MADIQAKIREFHEVFGRPVRDETVVNLSLEERILRAQLMWEEFHEWVHKGLGLEMVITPQWVSDDENPVAVDMDEGQREGNVRFRALQDYDPVEAADGLADIVVIAYGSALHQGINLDNCICEVHDSNMSKTFDGKPVVNGETEGYREGEPGFDPSKPIGKILKGPNYWQANIRRVIGVVR